MTFAILFCFYKELELCENRLQILKKYNPNLKVFGLYGGDKKSAEKYKKGLNNYLDDFYATPYQNSFWKWLNYDLQILDWYKKRGKNLKWDSVFAVQWDMLIFDSLLKQFKGIKKNQIFLSGLRLLDTKIEDTWNWTKPRSEYRKNYLEFLKYIKNNYNYKKTPLCCFFILQVFPKIFFEKYLTVKNKEIGILEYKVPIYADIFKIPFYKKDIGVKWFEKEEKPINSGFGEISKKYIAEQLNKKNGWRIFHPFLKIWKLDFKI